MTRLMKNFQIGQSVVVSSAGGWKVDAPGTIVAGPEPISTRQGDEYYYWVEFDQPQQDINGPDEYTRAQILSRYINGKN